MLTRVTTWGSQTPASSETQNGIHNKQSHATATHNSSVLFLTLRAKNAQDLFLPYRMQTGFCLLLKQHTADLLVAVNKDRTGMEINTPGWCLNKQDKIPGS